MRGFSLPKLSLRLSHSAWIRDCCLYHVMLLFCFVSRLAMFHSCAFRHGNLGDPEQVQGLPLREMSSRISHTWKIFLHEQCVDLKLSSISCRLVPLHRLSFSDVPPSCFQTLDLTQFLYFIF